MNDKSQILAALHQILLPLINVKESEIKPDARFADDLGVNSARLVDIVVELEDRFNIKISDSDIEKLATVGSTVEVVESYLNVSQKA